MNSPPQTKPWLRPENPMADVYRRVGKPLPDLEAFFPKALEEDGIWAVAFDFDAAVSLYNSMPKKRQSKKELSDNMAEVVRAIKDLRTRRLFTVGGLPVSRHVTQAAKYCGVGDPWTLILDLSRQLERLERVLQLAGELFTEKETSWTNPGKAMRDAYIRMCVRIFEKHNGAYDFDNPQQELRDFLAWALRYVGESVPKDLQKAIRDAAKSIPKNGLDFADVL